jgi:hypothetical protein
MSNPNIVCAVMAYILQRDKAAKGGMDNLFLKSETTTHR